MSLLSFLLSPGLLACASPPPQDTALDFPGEAGLYELSFDHDGGRRSAVVFVPDSAGPGSPLILNFHGFGGQAEQHLLTADLRTLAEEEGVVLAYPQGSDLDGSSHWNAALPSADNKSSAEDLDFARALVDNIYTEHGIDRDRVYAAGYSNGAMFAYSLACYGEGLVTAVVAVSGAFLNAGEDCSPAQPLPLLLLHGTADSVIPYEGDGETLAVSETLDFWAAHNGLSNPEESNAMDGNTRIETLRYTGGVGESAIVHHKVVGGGHIWFDLNVDGQGLAAMIWDFVSPYSSDALREAAD